MCEDCDLSVVISLLSRNTETSCHLHVFSTDNQSTVFEYSADQTALLTPGGGASYKSAGQCPAHDQPTIYDVAVSIGIDLGIDMLFDLICVRFAVMTRCDQI